jgi:anaerobic magnesium-protoporphyrin IX monomethyl ester cyclase
MEITLIRSALVSSSTSYSLPITPPIGLAYLSGALIRHGFKVTTIDAIGEDHNNITIEDGYIFIGLSIEDSIKRIPVDSDVVGISCMFTQDWPFSIQLIKAIRNAFPKTTIIAGGEHITALAEQSLKDSPEIDFCVLGEGEETIVEFMKAYENGGNYESVNGIAYIKNNKYVLNSPRQRISDIDSIARPSWDLFNIETYINSENSHGVFRGRTMPLIATRGCPYECTFCSNPIMYGKTYVYRDVDDVLDEIEDYQKLYKADNIDFYDLTMIIKKDWVIQFCKRIIERELTFTWQLPSGTRSEVIDNEVARWLYKTGCRNITYAPESGSVETLKLIKKKVKKDRLLKSIKCALKNNIKVKCNIIIGFPHEKSKNIYETLKFTWLLALIGVHDVPFYIFSPYPGSALFEQIKDKHYPEGLNKKYYKSLLSYMDLSINSAFCEHLSPSKLNTFRILGMSSFYILSFIIRPIRVFNLIKNILSQKSDTVLEQRLGYLYHKVFTY